MQRSPRVCTSNLLSYRRAARVAQDLGQVGEPRSSKGLQVSGCGPDSEGIFLGPGTHTLVAPAASSPAGTSTVSCSTLRPAAPPYPLLRSHRGAGTGNDHHRRRFVPSGSEIRVLCILGDLSHTRGRRRRGPVLACPRREPELGLASHRVGRSVTRGAFADRRLRQRLVRELTAWQELRRDAPIQTARDR